MAPKTLEQANTPRPSVFDPSVRDTVDSLDDLDRIDPDKFFAENYVTEGMRQLLQEAFTRLEGR
jgi:predicted AAA+ superfamily ATPase